MTNQNMMGKYSGECNYNDAPEDAADEELSYWKNNG